MAVKVANSPLAKTTFVDPNREFSWTPGKNIRRVVVCGSRKFHNPLNATAKIIERITKLPESATVIHGDAPGADRFAAEAARRIGLNVVAVPAKWEEHSETCRCRGHGYCREAGKRRNLLMLDMEPDLVIAFWNGSSGGTLHTIVSARERGLNLEIIRLT